MSISEKLSALEYIQGLFQIKYARTKMMQECVDNQTTIPAGAICNRNYYYSRDYVPQNAPHNLYQTGGRVGDLQAKWKFFLGFYRELTNHSGYNSHSYDVSSLGFFQPYRYKNYDCSWFPSFKYRGTVHHQWCIPLPVIESTTWHGGFRISASESDWMAGTYGGGERGTPDTNMPVVLASNFLDDCIEALESMVYDWGFIDCYTEAVTETRKAYVSESKTAYGTASKYENYTYVIPDSRTGGNPFYRYGPAYDVWFYASSIQHTYTSEDVETETESRYYQGSDIEYYEISGSHYQINPPGRFRLETSRPAQKTSFNINSYCNIGQDSYYFPGGYVYQYGTGLDPNYADARCSALSNNVMSASSYLNTGETKEDYQKTTTGTRQGLRFYNPYPFDIEIRLTVQTLPGEITVNKNPAYSREYDYDLGQYIDANFHWGNILYKYRRYTDKCWLVRTNTGEDNIDVNLSLSSSSLLGNNINLDCSYSPQVLHRKYGHTSEIETTYEEYEYSDWNTNTTFTATDTIKRKFTHIDSPDYDEHGTGYHDAVTNEYFELSNPTTTISNVSSHTVTLTLRSGEERTWFPTEHIPYDGTYDYFQICEEKIYSYVWADCRIKRPQNM